MKVSQFLDSLTKLWVDDLKEGDPESEISRVAVCFIATPDVIREAAEWGAQLIITHEPTYYNHMDRENVGICARTKKALIRETGIAICRYHDLPHLSMVDVIAAGFVEEIGWRGKFDGYRTLILDEPITPLEAARQIEERLGVRHVRIAGQRDNAVTRVKLYPGSNPTAMENDLYLDDSELVICGEVSEWSICEMARDSAQLGMNKTVLVLGHAGSEMPGMIYMAKLFATRYPEIEFKYFNSGEVYTYTD